MADWRADVALLVDFTDLRDTMCPHAAEAAEAADAADADGAAEVSGSGGNGAASTPAAPEADDGPLAEALLGGEVARHLVRYAASIGRLAVARAYADWSRCAPLAGVFQEARLEPVLVLPSEDGEDRSHVRLVCDALESLYDRDEPDAFVLVTGDPTLVPLVQAIRAKGSEVVVVGPERGVARELRDAADRYVPIEEVLSGAEGTAPQPRFRRSRGGLGEERGRGRADEPRRERPPHPTPIRSDQDFERYDWGPFIRLIDELEHRLPFVGVRYLVNKVLGGHNVGVEDPRLKRDLINRAVDVALIEMYPVGNVGDRADPVTACRLERKHETVVATLGATETPQGPAEHHDGEVEDEEDEGVSSARSRLGVDEGR